jgi:hypothetical protein
MAEAAFDAQYAAIWVRGTAPALDAGDGEHGGRVYREHRRPVIIGELQCRRRTHDAGCVDQDGDRTEVALDALDHLVEGRGHREIDWIAHHRTVGGQLGDRARESLRRAVQGRDDRTAPDQRRHDRRADAAGGAGDDRDGSGDPVTLRPAVPRTAHLSVTLHV